jgi:excisionase family DNA binding protein
MRTEQPSPSVQAHADRHTLQVVAIGAPTVPRLALSKREAAQALGVSVTFFEAEIAHELRMVRRGRQRLVPVAELQRWLAQHADLAGAA